MALTSRDFDKVKIIVTEAVADLPTRNDLDRLEGRITTAIGLLQRDTFARLDQHEERITRLEKANAK